MRIGIPYLFKGIYNKFKNKIRNLIDTCINVLNCVCEQFWWKHFDQCWTHVLGDPGPDLRGEVRTVGFLAEGERRGHL